MKKYKSLDGHYVYRIKKDKKFHYLANRLDYQADIKKLLDTFDDLKYDSVIFIFGFDTGEYLEALNNLICTQNQVFILEPNKKIYEKYKSYNTDQLHLILFEETSVTKILNNTIYFRNIHNIYFYAFGNYKTIYKKEYDFFIEHLDWAMINAASQISLAKRFKKIFIQNMIANIKTLDKSTPIHHYLFSNHNVPAIVVSAGPSLDKNIKDMLKYKEKLNKCFIITGSRTVDALIKNGIRPDLIISVDPVNANYDMMKDHLDLDIPLAYYEYSNRYLIRDYQGEKLFISLLFSKTMESFHHYKSLFCGGSVAHSCIDMANMLGCSPILLVGQDFAYTYEKHHAESAIFDYDKQVPYQSSFTTKDVYGNNIPTNQTLDYFKKRTESYLDLYKDQKQIRFINCSYGADIKGAPHKELTEVFEEEPFLREKTKLIPHQDIVIEKNETIGSILQFVDEFIQKSHEGLELCKIIIEQGQQKSLIDVDDNDLDLQRILYILQIVDDFENNPNSQYLGGYFSEFLFEMKETIFQMYAKEYEKLTSDLQHQAHAFDAYFDNMDEILNEVKKLVLETVSEFYE